MPLVPPPPQSVDYVSRFFDANALVGMERMRFTTRRRAEGSYTGRHSAKRIGGAGEFVDHREYSPGDDLRHVDWKAMGRTGRAYLKTFQDDTDLNCTLLLDCSGSMAQGARSAKDFRGSKLEWMQYFATALSHLILYGRDALGLAAIRNELIDYFPAAASIQSRPLIHQTIENLRPEDGTNLAKGLDELLVRVRRRGVLMIVSDFLVDPIESTVAGIRKFRARGWEVVTLHLIHPDEQKLPEGNAFQFIGLEGEGEVACQLSEVRREYQKRFEAMASSIQIALTTVGCDHYRIVTTENYLDVLRSFLVMRSA